jgi:hypothetical protein
MLAEQSAFSLGSASAQEYEKLRPDVFSLDVFFLEAVMGDLLRGLVLPGGDLAGDGELLLEERDSLLRERPDRFLGGV